MALDKSSYSNVRSLNNKLLIEHVGYRLDGPSSLWNLRKRRQKPNVAHLITIRIRSALLISRSCLVDSWLSFSDKRFFTLLPTQVC